MSDLEQKLEQKQWVVGQGIQPNCQQLNSIIRDAASSKKSADKVRRATDSELLWACETPTHTITTHLMNSCESIITQCENNSIQVNHR